jgi:hypothetical protein
MTQHQAEIIVRRINSKIVTLHGVDHANLARFGDGTWGVDLIGKPTKHNSPAGYVPVLACLTTVDAYTQLANTPR